MPPTATRRRRPNRANGFTVIELMVVLVILGLIASLVYQAVIPKVDEAKHKTARAQMEILGLALDNYRLDVGTYPAALAELAASSSPGWKGPYLRKSVPADPWGNPYFYEIVDEGKDYRLGCTAGGTEVVIKSWE
jgi:general secretion pathway protein G